MPPRYIPTDHSRRHLALVTLIRTDTYEAHKGLIEYNVTFYRRAIHKIIDIEAKNQREAREAREAVMSAASSAMNVGKGKSAASSRYGTFQ